MEQIAAKPVNQSWFDNDMNKVRESTTTLKLPLQDSTNMNMSLTLGKMTSSCSIISHKFVVSFFKT